MPLLTMSLADDNLRQEYLENLYELDGRADKSHLMHSLYTGLYQDLQLRDRLNHLQSTNANNTER